MSFLDDLAEKTRVLGIKKKKPSTSIQTQSVMETLGNRIRTARLRRNETVEHAASRIGVSRQTWRKLEQGDSSISSSLLLEALILYGFGTQLQQIAKPEDDAIGKFMDEKRLPKRGRSK